MRVRLRVPLRAQVPAWVPAWVPVWARVSARAWAQASRFDLRASVTGQRAGKNLDSSEQISLGGPNGVRAYPVGEAGADEGFIASLEAGWSASAAWRLWAFYDHGHAKLRKQPWAALASVNSYSLRGAGVGAEYADRSGLSFRAVPAGRIGSNPAAAANGADSDGRSSRARLWLNLARRF